MESVASPVVRVAGRDGSTKGCSRPTRPRACDSAPSSGVRNESGFEADVLSGRLLPTYPMSANGAELAGRGPSPDLAPSPAHTSPISFDAARPLFPHVDPSHLPVPG